MGKKGKPTPLAFFFVRACKARCRHNVMHHLEIQAIVCESFCCHEGRKTVDMDDAVLSASA